MAMLTFRRPGGDSGGLFRDLQVLLDGEYVVGLLPGYSWAVRVPAGRYEVVGRMDWARSPVLVCEVQDDEDLVVEVSLTFLGVLESFVPGRRPVRVRATTRTGSREAGGL
ncbi:hypothetical protein [Jannaschia sp. R86511]|uniref:hypothetical protein n=1 Tax=Jannaschia sp. R86511 TaxID=3093853 RepID=UPI0036D43BF0